MHKHTFKIRLAAGALAAALLFTGCNTTDPSAKLVSINKGKDSISFGYGNFFTRFTQADYDQYYLAYYGNNYWREKLMDETKTTEESVKEEVMDEMKSLYQSRVHASEFGVKLTDQDNKKIDKAVKAFLKDNEQETLKAMGATEAYAKQMLEEQTYEARLKQAMEEKRDKELKDSEVNQTGFSYVQFLSGATKDKDGKEIKYSNKELKAMADKAASAKDFEAAVKETGFDLDSDNYTTSLSAKKAADESGLPEELFAQLKKLHEGERTGVIPSEEGKGYIVARLDKTLDEEWTKAKRQNLQEKYYNDTMEQWNADTKWDVDEKLWAKVHFKEVFENPETGKTEASDEAAESDADETGEDSGQK